mmetsp:Transcript_10184/g.22435  ORF Transcript_10184/g.22435 Transcript_10184/m.22435 type:complete len:318 (-) Transcript_10184:167-1120(-)|eukprot:CAMPEP_0168747758 /NCGR_PEP_ID=MMETSP0724-20121128/15823_1 /TAXON_ID=265536 /ORGANISM="Amphiprora sp., Strain CCMP467" /LENGTH=317 /DNA_ID=CAMNT_0008795561 /DNA_START=33 /DNA_END=986 /DNA_ORIENTATION=+
MAPPAAKLRKRKNKGKKGGSDEEPIDMFGLGDGASNGQSDFDFPMPPAMQSKGPEPKVETVATDDDDDDDDMPAPSRMSQRKSKGKKNNMDDIQLPSDKGIKWGPLLMLIIMFGTTLIPAVLFVGDSVSGFLAKSDILGQIGFRLGIGAVPRKRVMSFYEKHNPEKVNDVPKLLAKHYGEYPKLIKKLERKYQDYGYFMGWEEDEAPARLVKDQFNDMYSVWIQDYWNKYAPLEVRSRVRNVKYNLLSVYKQGKKIWKKHVWPLLEPLLGVPDEKTAEKQKRKDAKRASEAQQKKRGATGGGSSTRRKNTEYRDSDE